jgi:16S rRNA (guanine966-N2)-methyltransferase
MRIIAGLAKGMVLAAPKGDVRPTSDRVREAIFSSLGDRVVDAEVLDLYAGTGALGLEAASRGARSVTFVERSPDAIRKNIETYRKNAECEFEILRGDVLAHLKRLSRHFSLIFADPPYAMDPVGIMEVVHDRLAPGGTFVLELSKRTKLDAGLLWKLDREAVYGDTRVCYFRAVRLGGN